MDADTLERLLMDRALKNLPPDCEALLESHLATNSAAQNDAAELMTIVDRCRLALVADAPALPPMSRHDFSRALRKKTRASTLRWVAAGLGMAACLAVGLTLGRVGSTSAAPSPKGVSVAVANNAAPSAHPGAGVEDFWSAARLRAAAAQPHPAQRPYAIGSLPIFNGLQLQETQP